MVTGSDSDSALLGSNQPKGTGDWNTPEGVSDSVLEVEEAVLVDAQEVPGVEVKVSLPEDIVQLLLLSLLQVSGVTLEGRVCGDFTHQESRLTCAESPTHSELVSPGGKSSKSTTLKPH